MKGLQAQVEGEVLAFTTKEGGQFIGGHGMSEENKLRTASGLSDLWDGNAIRRVEAHRARMN